MAVDPDLLDLAAAWRPQRPGRERLKDIADALVEPDWEGLRGSSRADRGPRRSFVRDGEEITVPAELPEALVDAFTRDRRAGRGHGSPRWRSERRGRPAGMPEVERPPLLVPRVVRKSEDDPYVKAREYERARLAAAPRVLDALAGGERHAFVATDLLWLDGTPLDDVPLLERKRLLDGVLDASFLVRVTPFVQGGRLRSRSSPGARSGSRSSTTGPPTRATSPGEENPDWP